MSQRPFWSVIIPVKGRTQYLPTSLGSVLDQDLGPDRMEIILVENPTEKGDYPATPFASKLGNNRPIRHLANPTDRGLYGSINQAVAASNGEFIHVLHDDDWVLPGFYERLQADLSVWEWRWSTGAAFTHYINVHEGVVNPLTPGTWTPPPFNPGYQGPEFLSRILRGNPLQMCAVVFNLRHFEAVGPFDEALPHCSDWHWYIRSFLKASWWHVAEPLARYRVHATNQTHADLASGLAQANIKTVLESIPELLYEAIRQ